MAQKIRRLAYSLNKHSAGETGLHFESCFMMRDATKVKNVPQVPETKPFSAPSCISGTKLMYSSYR